MLAKNADSQPNEPGIGSQKRAEVAPRNFRNTRASMSLLKKAAGLGLDCQTARP